MRNLIKNGTQLIFLFILFGAFAVSAGAATFTVNSIADNPDANTADNVCDVDLAAAGNQCTLRAAIEQANASAGADTINFDAATNAQTIIIGEQPYDPINGQLTITGNGASASVVDGNGNNRIFTVASGATVGISSLTVANGYVGESSGGGIFNQGNLTLTNVVVRNNEVRLGRGGGIFSSGTLTIVNSEIYSNQTSGFGDGGGIFNSGTLNVTNSTIRNNTAADGGGGVYNDGGSAAFTRSTLSGNGASDGAGIYNTNGSVTLNTSTISANTAANIGGGYYGFADLSATTLSASASTIASNIASNGGGIALSSSVGISSATIDNTIVGDNSATIGADIFSPAAPSAIASGGYNLIENTSGGTFVSTPTDIVGVDPGLQPLANNGGSTPTHALKSTSPAIDKGNNTAADQRGVARPIDNPNVAPALGGNNADIGAYEAAAAPTAASFSIGGRISTANGKGIAYARVRLIEADGNVRLALTNSFGFYRFADVDAGQTATIEVQAKRYYFSPLVVSINQETVDLNFAAQF